MKLRLHRIFICQAFAMLRNVQQRKLRLSPFEQHGVPFTLVVAESDIFPVNVPVASLQLSDQFAFGYLPAPQKPVWTDIVGERYRLPPFERAVRCTKYFEGWHSEKHHPYVGYGHRLQPGERYSARTMTKRQADALLRKDLRKFCAMFQQFGKDSLLLATLAYNVGPYRLLGSGKIPKSTLIRKLEAGDRNIYREYIAFCNYKGKRHAMLLKRRKAEFALLYVP